MNSDIMSARQQIILRVLRGLVAFAFVLFGTLKLIGIPMMVDVFDHVGLGQWFRYATGVIEVGACCSAPGSSGPPLWCSPQP